MCISKGNIHLLVYLWSVNIEVPVDIVPVPVAVELSCL